MEEKCFDVQQFKGTGNTCKRSTNELTIISVFYTTAYKINLLLCLIKLSLNLENMNGLQTCIVCDSDADYCYPYFK